jgi:hypothetical protein
MRSVRQGQEREDFVNLLVVKDAPNRKLYPRANLLRAKLLWLQRNYNNAPDG